MGLTALLGRRQSADTTAAAPVAEPRIEVPSRNTVIDAIIGEATAAGVRCDAQRAVRVIELFQRVARNKGGWYLLNDTELDVEHGPHDVMDVIVPDTDGAEPRAVKAGSAENLLTRHVLKGRSGRFVHTSDWEDGVRYCAVHMTLIDA